MSAANHWQMMKLHLQTDRCDRRVANLIILLLKFAACWQMKFLFILTLYECYIEMKK